MILREVVLIGTASPRPTPATAVLMPTTWPRESARAPPELPGLSAASVWITSSTIRVAVRVRTGSARPSPLTMPAVTLPAIPRGLPTATTRLPIRRSSTSRKTGGSTIGWSTRTTARSASGSRPMTSRRAMLPSANVASPLSALPTTWALVSRCPSALSTTAEPDASPQWPRGLTRMAATRGNSASATAVTMREYASKASCSVGSMAPPRPATDNAVTGHGVPAPRSGESTYRRKRNIPDGSYGVGPTRRGVRGADDRPLPTVTAGLGRPRPGLRAGRLHERDPAEPVVDVVDLAGVAKTRLDEECDDAIAEVADHCRGRGHPRAHQAGKVQEGVGPAVAVRGMVSILGVEGWAAEVRHRDLASGPKGAQSVVRERDSTVRVDVVQRQRRQHMVEGGVLGRNSIGVSLDQGEEQAAAERLVCGPTQGVPVRVKTRDPGVRLSCEDRERQVAGTAADVNHLLSGRDAGQLHRALEQRPIPGHPGEDVVEREEPRLPHARQERTVSFIRCPLVDDAYVRYGFHGGSPCYAALDVCWSNAAGMGALQAAGRTRCSLVKSPA